MANDVDELSFFLSLRELDGTIHGKAQTNVQKISRHASKLHALLEELLPLFEPEQAAEASVALLSAVEEIEVAERALWRAAEGVERAVREFQAPFQARRLPDWAQQAMRAGELRLHLGGKNFLGFLNLDLGHVPTLSSWWYQNRQEHSLGSPLMRWNFAEHGLSMLPDGSCSHVYASHVLEHLRYPSESQVLLREMARVLRPGGRVRLVVPDATRWIRNSGFLDDDGDDGSSWSGGSWSGRPFWRAVREQYSAWPEWDDPSSHTPLSITLRFLGAGGSGLDANRAGHNMGYDFATLKVMLQAAGFAGVARTWFNQTSDKALRSLDTLGVEPRKGWKAPSGEWEHFSLFAEAVKPSGRPSPSQDAEQKGSSVAAAAAAQRMRQEAVEPSNHPSPSQDAKQKGSAVGASAVQRMRQEAVKPSDRPSPSQDAEPYGSNAAAAVQRLGHAVVMMHVAAMDFWKTEWLTRDCDRQTEGGWVYPWPCYLTMWEHIWSRKQDLVRQCWRPLSEVDAVQLCALTSYAMVLLMLKQAGLWENASYLFYLGKGAGLHSITRWPGLLQTPWFVRFEQAADLNEYVPGGSGRLDEPVGPPPGPAALDGAAGLFDPARSSALRPIALALRESWPAILAEYAARRTSEASAGKREAERWLRYLPGKEGWWPGSWWGQGKAGVDVASQELRLWGGFPGHDDAWWNNTACSLVSPTLCRVLKSVLPTTQRPVPKYVTSTSGRWEFVQVYRLWPGGSHALHSDPTRCFWQVCLEGCSGAFIQVGKTAHEYVEGEMIAYDGTFDHAVWNSKAAAARTVIHGSLHYCHGAFL